MMRLGQPPGNSDYGTRCPHCGKRTDQTPEELSQLDKIAKSAKAVIKKMKRVKIK